MTLAIPLQSLRIVDALLLAAGGWLLHSLYQTIRLRARTTRLKGPRSNSWLWGLSRDTFQGDIGAIYEQMAKEYGTIFAVPSMFGARKIVLTDPKAISHFYANETYTYVQNDFTKNVIQSLVGKGVLWAEGDSHRRQRRTLSPAFSNAAIRQLIPVFYDSAYKVKTSWDQVFETIGRSSDSEEIVIDVQKWRVLRKMNCVSLDSIGIAGFGHDFGALEGRQSSVEQVFNSFSTLKPDPIFMIIVLLGGKLPFLFRFPNPRSKMMVRLHETMSEIAEELLMRSRKETEAGGMTQDMNRSIIGTLIRSENTDAEFRLSEEEILAQMNVLILAGYETTSISLTWALIELSLNPGAQDKLRAELSEFAHSDPTYEQLHGSLPYLDAVFREILRLHPPVQQTGRYAAWDDAIPLSKPLTTTTGEVVDHITVSKGTQVVVPILGVNRSEDIWGPDAKEFKPERWLNDEQGLTKQAKEIQGYHHIMSFVDGQRMCLGRAFAVAEFKSVLSVLIRNYVFDMRDGPETKIEMITTILPRPRVAGEEGYSMPMRVRRYEQV